HLEPEEILVEETTVYSDDTGTTDMIPGGIQLSESMPLHDETNGHDERSEHILSSVQADETDIILVVEDSTELRDYIRGILKPHYTVVEAVNGKEGIQKAKEVIPDLIISDLMMPETDGFELCRTLKNQIDTSHIPIILLTAKASEGNVVEGLESGADDYVTKPFNTNILLARITSLIRLRQQLRKTVNPDTTMKPVNVELSSIDREFVKELKIVIDSNLSDPDLNVEELSKRLYMGRTTLYRKIQALTGKTPTAFIRSYRIKRAAQLLETHEGNISDVALKVGFLDRSYFAKCFKDQFHRLPSDFQSPGSGIGVAVNDAIDRDQETLPEGIAQSSTEPGEEVILVVEDNNDSRAFIMESLQADY
ncbi:MAG: response regulator, partial [bacterium]|nr:response regulator [bacterium]